MNAKYITPLLLLALLLAACGTSETPMPTPDVGAIQTAAAETVMADILATQNASASLTPLASPTAEATQPPAETPTVTVTLTVGVFATPGVLGTPGLCDDAAYVSDVTVPDGSVMTPGQEFLKTWKVRNTGDCTWGAGYTLIYGGYNDRMSGVPAALTTTVIPNQEVDVSVQFKAPATPKEYLSAWRMANPNGYAFGQFFFVKIIVR
ncbi:MAG: NBR1-Ig-like domain-containing protein [Chloroflexota bacterium]